MPRYIALEFDPHGLSVAVANVGTTGVRLERTLGRFDQDMSLSWDKAQALGQELGNLLKEAKVPSAPVLAVVGRDRIIIKDVNYPDSPPNEEPAIIRFQAQRDLGDVQQDLIMDYVPRSKSGGSESKRASVAFIPKSTYNTLFVICQSAGLKLASVTPRSFTFPAVLNRAIQNGILPAAQSGQSGLALLILSADGGEFCVVAGNELLFARSIPKMAMSNPGQLLGEVRKSLMIFGSNNPQTKLDYLCLVEGHGSATSWLGRLETALSLPVYSFDPIVDSPDAEHIPPGYRGRFLGPVGVLTSFTHPKAVPINFVTPRQPKKEGNKGMRRGLVLALLLLCAVGVAGLIGYLQLNRLDTRITSLQQQQRTLDMQIKALEPDLKRVQAANDFRDREIQWLDWLYDLATIVPNVDKVRIQELDASAIAPKIQKKSTVRRIGPSMTAQNTNQGSKIAPIPELPNSTKKEDKSSKEAVAKLRLVLRSDDGKLVEKMVDEMRKDPYFLAVNNSILGKSSARSTSQLFSLTADIAHKELSNFDRLIDAKMPDPPKVIEKEAFTEDIPRDAEVIRRSPGAGSEPVPMGPSDEKKEPGTPGETPEPKKDTGNPFVND